MKRHEDNMIILDLLKQLMDKYPDQRFGQILSNYVIPMDMFDIFLPEGKEFIDNMKQYV